MVELEKPLLMQPSSWRTQALGEESFNWRQRMPSLRREIPRTRFSIFRKAVQRSQS